MPFQEEEAARLNQAKRKLQRELDDATETFESVQAELNQMSRHRHLSRQWSFGSNMSRSGMDGSSPNSTSALAADTEDVPTKTTP